MGELTEYFKERYGKKQSITQDKITKTSVKNTIAELCEKYLEDANYVFTFEVDPRMLEYAVMVIDEEPLKSKYIITQISKTLFQAELIELDIDI